MLEFALHSIFLLSAFLLFFGWLAYPLLLLLWSKVGGGKTRHTGTSTSDIKSVAVVVMAHNEAARIEKRIRNLVACRPDNRIDYRIIIMSDHSTDDTVPLCKHLETTIPGLKVLEATQGRGRASGQNEAVSMLNSDIIFFTDAETEFETDFITKGLAAFARPDVGFITGQLVWKTAGDETRLAEFSLYWEYEIFLRKLESALGVCAVGTGACCAVRKAAFKSLQSTSDIDSATPLDVVQNGYLCLFLPEAVAYDYINETAEREFRARVRMTSKNLADLVSIWHWRRNWIRFPGHSIGLLAHKLLRWFTPYTAQISLVTALVLAATGRASSVELLYVLVMLAFFLAALAGYFRPNMPFAGSAWNFCNVMIGFALGVANWYRNKVPRSY